MGITNVILRISFILIGLLLNLFVLLFLYGFWETKPIVPWVAAFEVLFFLSMLTPVGDFWLDLSMGTRVPTRKEDEVLQSVEAELREAAVAHGEKFPNKLRLRVITDPYPNAMAFGGRTVAITSGLLKTGTYEEIRGVFAHEVGHIVNRDTLFNMVVYGAFGPLLFVGNTVIRLANIGAAINPWINIFIWMFSFVLLFPAVLAIFVYWLFSKMLSFCSRGIEYAADAFAIRLTRDEGLLSFLDSIEHLDSGPNGRFLAAYQASHPPTALREDRARIILENL